MYWNILADWIFCTAMPLLTEYAVLEYACSLNILYWSIAADWIYCNGIFLLTEYITTWNISCWIDILYCNVHGNILPNWIFWPGISLLNRYFVLQCPREYSSLLNILCWIIAADWICCNEILLLIEYFVLMNSVFRSTALTTVLRPLLPSKKWLSHGSKKLEKGTFFFFVVSKNIAEQAF